MRVPCLLLCLACAAAAQEKSYAAAVDAVLNDEFDKARSLLPEQAEVLTLPEYATLSLLGRESVGYLRPLLRRTKTDVPVVRQLQAIARDLAAANPTEESRAATTAVIERIGSFAVPALIAMLDHPHPRVQREVARLLGALGDARAIAPLSAALDRGMGGAESKAVIERSIEQCATGEATGELELDTAGRYLRLALRYLATREIDRECYLWAWVDGLVAHSADPLFHASAQAEAAARRSEKLRPTPEAWATVARASCLRSMLLEAYGVQPTESSEIRARVRWDLLLAVPDRDWVLAALLPESLTDPLFAVQAELLDPVSRAKPSLPIVASVAASLWSPSALVRSRAVAAAARITSKLPGEADELPFVLPDAEPAVIEAATKLLLAADLDSQESEVVLRALERTLGAAMDMGPNTAETAPEFVELAGGDPEPTEVVVFYGTDRAEFSPDFAYYASEYIGALIALLAALILPRAFRWMFRKHLQVLVPISRWLGWAATVVLAFSATYTCARVHLKHERLGFEYGGERGPFDDDKGPYCHLGRCVVGIPPLHLSGEVERPQPLTGDLWEDPDKHVILLSIEPETDKARFFGDVRKRAREGDNSAFVFVHGFNVTFEDAALRTAQMTHDLNFQGAPMFFSWPSRGSLLRYTYDESTVAWATRHLKRFLRDVRKELPDATIHLVAHSMGNRALTEALRRLASEIEHRQLKPFQEVVLAAPDIDGATFRNDIAPAIRSTAERVTLYASSADEALVVSKQVHGYPRAGDSGERIIVVEGVQTIDVSARLDSSVLGHSYYGSVGRVLDDLIALLRKRHMPDDRGLARVLSEDGVHWRIE